MEFGPSHIAAAVNLGALIWGAAKMHSSIILLKEFRQNISSDVGRNQENIAKIDLRVSLVEQEIDTLQPSPIKSQEVWEKNLNNALSKREKQE